MASLRRLNGITRREFINRALAAGIALPSVSALLAACARREDAVAQLAIGTPASPVAQPLFEDNVAIASGMPVEVDVLVPHRHL